MSVDQKSGLLRLERRVQRTINSIINLQHVLEREKKKSFHLAFRSFVHPRKEVVGPNLVDGQTNFLCKIFFEHILSGPQTQKKHVFTSSTLL